MGFSGTNFAFMPPQT